MSLFRPEVFESKRLQRFGRTVPLYAHHSLPITLVLLFFLLVAAVWMVTGNYAKTQIVEGWVVPNGAMARIQPLQPGMLASIDVSEGQSVRQGQRLATVQLQSGNSATDDPAGQSLGLLQRQNSEVDAQAELFRASNREDEARLRASAREMSERLNTMAQQIAIQQKRVDSARKSFEIISQAERERAINRIDFENQRRAYLGEQAQLQQLASDRAALRAQYVQTTADLRQLPIKLNQHLADLRGNTLELEKQRLLIERDRSIVLTAPFNGVVGVLQAKPGQTLAPQQPVMQILGADTVLEAELYAPTRAIGFARVGQEVRLMYDAFPYEQFGTFKGTITEISRSALSPQEITAPLKLEGASYRIRIRLDQQAVRAFGKYYPVQPGMTLKANVILERQSFLQWLLEPVNAVRNRM